MYIKLEIERKVNYTAIHWPDVHVIHIHTGFIYIAILPKMTSCNIYENQLLISRGYVVCSFHGNHAQLLW